MCCRCFQLVAVRVALGADADHTGLLGGEGVGAEGGSWIIDLTICTLQANKLQIGVIEATVCDQLRTCTLG